MKLLSGRIWAKVDGVSSNGYHERRLIFQANQEEHWPAGSRSQKHQKSKTLIDFAISTTDGNTTWVIAHVWNPQAVRPVTCSVRWHERCIQKFFDLYFASILVSSIRTYAAGITSKLTNICTVSCMYLKLLSRVYGTCI